MTEFVLGSMDSLPEGWATAVIGKYRQKRSRTFNPSSAPDETYELYSVPSHVLRDPELITPSEIGSNKQHVEPGDVLISKINPRLNRTWVVGDKGKHAQIASTEWVVFPKSEALEPRYLAHLLSDRRLRDFLAANASGVGGSLTRIRPDLFDSVQVPLPPVSEQHRITEKIETLFDEIDKGLESLQAAKATLGVYRQSLLKGAFEGRLTAEWREQNADKLDTPETLINQIRSEREARYKAALNEWEKAVTRWRADGGGGKKPRKPRRPAWPTGFDFSSLTDLPEGWKYVPFEVLAWSIRNGISAKPDEVGPLKIFRISAVRPMKFDLEDFRRITDPDGRFDSYRLEFGDLVFTRYNGSRDYVGVSAMYRGDGTHVHPDKLIRCEIKSQFLNPEFLEAATNCGESRKHIEGRIRTTAGQSGISGADIKQMPVPLCSRAEQTEIVARIASKLEVAETVEAEIDEALRRGDALRQSILKKAFSGQLVPQDPSDEPASAMLDRIQSARRQAPDNDRRKASA